MMNLLLHGIEGGLELADTLSPDGERLAKADLVLTNPPFGTKKGGGRPTRSDFSVTADTSNKQLAFVEHIVRALGALAATPNEGEESEKKRADASGGIAQADERAYVDVAFVLQRQLTQRFPWRAVLFHLPSRKRQS